VFLHVGSPIVNHQRARHVVARWHDTQVGERSVDLLALKW
jgi:hypothetical protein